LIPAELIAELAASARLRPLVHPGDAPPEPGLRPVEGIGRLRALPGRDLPGAWM